MDVVAAFCVSSAGTYSAGIPLYALFKKPTWEIASTY